MGNPKKKWTAEEEDALRAGVAKYGTGKWRIILQDTEFNPHLHSRSNIDLKDKWRNMTPKPKGALSVAIVPLPAAPAPVPLDVIMEGSQKCALDGTASKYDAMIHEALSTLKDPNGSDASAIVSFIEEQGQALPSNLRSLLIERLTRLVQQDKLEKVQNCYRLRNEALNGTRDRAQPNPHIMAPPPPPPQSTTTTVTNAPSMTTLDLFPIKDLSPSPQQQQPSDLFVTKTPKEADPEPNPHIMAAKAKAFEWEKSSIQTFPPQAVLQSSPYELCMTHQSLMNAQVQPKDDVYSQLPSYILEHRRPNGKEKLHLVHTKRHLVGDCRRIGNLAAEWVEKSRVEVVGIDGEIVGHQFSLYLVFFPHDLIVEGEWSMEEFVSVKCEKGDTSVVQLKCSNVNWEKVELQVQKAESELLESYKKKMFVFESEAALGICISELEKFRKQFKEAEEQRSGGVLGSTSSRVEGLVGSSVGVEHLASSTGVNLGLRLGLVGADGVLAPTKMKDPDQDPHLATDVPDVPSRREPPGGFKDLM